VTICVYLVFVFVLSCLLLRFNFLF